MSLRQQLVRRVVEPPALRFYQWRGDPVAMFMRPETKADPYPLYAELRRRGLVRSSLGFWVTARHETAATILRDRRFSTSPVHRRGYRPPAYPAGDPRAELPATDMLTMDPPDHTRLRRLVSSAFTPTAVAGLEPWIREVTDRLLSSVDATTGFDLIDALALPLPITVICHLLGVPSEDQAKFGAWGHEIVTALEPQSTPSGEGQTRAAELAVTAYLKELVCKRRADPDDSLLSALIAAEAEGDRLSSPELVSTAALLLIAGFITTVNLIGNGTVALLAEQQQWARLHEEPALVPAAIEELVRYDSPVQVTSRHATEDVDVDGTVIPRGATVILAIGGANRDPAAFDEPDVVRIDRAEVSRHLAFSLGMHHCIGAALARLEGRIAVAELTRRYPTLELAGTPVRRPLLTVRGFETVPVRAR